MLDTHREHQRSTASVLRHLTCRVGESLHKWHQSGRGEGRVVDGRTLGAQLAQVVTHAAAALHELHLLLVDAHDGAIRVGIAVEAYHKAVAQRGHLMVVADTRHGASGRHYVSEMVNHIEHLLGAHRIVIVVLYSRDFIGYSPVHICGRLLIDVACAVFHGILVDPYSGCQLIAVKIGERGTVCFVVRICFQFAHNKLDNYYNMSDYKATTFFQHERAFSWNFS